MEIKQNLVSSSKYDIKCPYERTPQFYVVHNTYNDAPAKNEVSYMIGNNNKVSFHYAVDDVEVVQGLLENRSAFAEPHDRYDSECYRADRSYLRADGADRRRF